MKIRLITSFAAFLVAASLNAQTQYLRADSIRITSLMAKARTMRSDTNWMLHFGRQFIGGPYVGGTLDRGQEERLVVNTRELDCTTFVEQVLALKMCMDSGRYAFSDFCDNLRRVRYINGEVSYVARQHYFTVWMENNESMGIVRDIQSPNPPFTALQHLDINYMTSHIASYNMLKAHPEWTEGIRRMEQCISGRTYRYIPKGKIANTRLLRNTIKDGDVIVILTKKQGLDTSHIGIAAWHKDGLHLLNASSLRHKVVEEPKTLYRYMQGQASQIGIRVCRP